MALYVIRLRKRGLAQRLSVIRKRMKELVTEQNQNPVRHQRANMSLTEEAAKGNKMKCSEW